MCVCACTVIYMRLFFSVPDEDVRKYCENQKKNAKPPLQVPEVDSCVPRPTQRIGITLQDDPEGQCVVKLHFSFYIYKTSTGQILH